MQRTIFRRILVAGMMIGFTMSAGRLFSQIDYEQPPIDYLGAKVSDPVSELIQRVETQQTKLNYTADHGYLESILEQLQVPVSSQVLVFSKTSFQRDRISPKTPRALYFNDDVYVGWVPYGDVVELSAVDPQQGAIFYAAMQKPDAPTPLVRHNDQCLQCHSSSMTRGVPGHLVRSVFTDTKGMPIFHAGTFRTDDTSPLKERWGGWYVSGTHGKQRHMGNVCVVDDEHPEDTDFDQGANTTDLSHLFDTAKYLSVHSDIVALMVLEHQSAMHNCLTAANFEARLAAHQCAVMNEALGRDLQYESESTSRRYDRAAQKVVESLLFCGETVLTDPIIGTSGFAEEFANRGPFDGQGRSLRQFDLEHRMMRYPCSYLIYSASFDGLPAQVLSRVYQQLHDVLTGRGTSPKFAHLNPETKTAIREILRETKPGLPDYW
jgi:hypothetical protein